MVPAAKVVGRTARIRSQAQVYRAINLDGNVRPQLEEQCRRNGITGYSRLKKEELKDAIIHKLFYEGNNETVEFTTLVGRFQCSKATATALQTALGETVPGAETLIETLFELLDESLANGGQVPSSAISQLRVLDKLREAKQRYGWCSTADSCVRDMGIDVGRPRSFYDNLTVEVATVKRIAQDYGNRGGLTREVDTLLHEMGIDV